VFPAWWRGVAVLRGNVMTIDPIDQLHQDHGAGRCWPLPSAGDEAVLCRPAVDSTADVPVPAPPAPLGAGHGTLRPDAARSAWPSGSPSGPEPADNPAGVLMPAFDERRAAALACHETAAHRYAYGCLAVADGALVNDRSAAIELVTA
jgi:hypothetical protein